MYKPTTIVFAVLTVAATPALARETHAAAVAGGMAGDRSAVQSRCDAKLSGNSDWYSVVMDSGHAWPLYAFASNDYPYYDHGYCDYGNLYPPFGYGFVPGPSHHAASPIHRDRSRH